MADAMLHGSTFERTITAAEILLAQDAGKLVAIMSGQFFIITTTTKQPSEYASLADAVDALKGLTELQSARGYATERNPSGRHMSKHPDKPLIMFWIEDAGGKVVS